MKDKKCCRKLIFDNIKYNSKKCTGKGEKAAELFPVSIFSKGGFMISHVLSYFLVHKTGVQLFDSSDGCIPVIFNLVANT